MCGCMCRVFLHVASLCVPTLHSINFFLLVRFLELAQVKANQDDDAAVIQYQVKYIQRIYFCVG